MHWFTDIEFQGRQNREWPTLNVTGKTYSCWEDRDTRLQSQHRCSATARKRAARIAMGPPLGEDPDRPSLRKTQSRPIHSGWTPDKGLLETVEPARPCGFRCHRNRLSHPHKRANPRNQEKIPVSQEANRIPAPEEHQQGGDEQRFGILRVIDRENERVGSGEELTRAVYTPDEPE